MCLFVLKWEAGGLYAPLESILAMDWAKEGFSATIKTVFILNWKATPASNLNADNKIRPLRPYDICLIESDLL